MTRSELIQALCQQRPELTPLMADRVIECFTEAIGDALAAGHRVELRGFGVFESRHRGPRPSRNPKTGEALQTQEKHVPFFKIGKELHDKLNPKES